MKLVRWEFQSLHIPMIEMEDGLLVCCGKQLAESLGTTEGALRSLRLIRKKSFSNLSVNSIDAKGFLEKHKVEFGIQRLRKDIRIWTEDDMIMAAVLVKSERGDEFRMDLAQFIKKNATRVYIEDIKQRDQLIAELRSENDFMKAHAERVTALEAELAEARPYLQQMASAAGKVLQVQTKTKHLRVV